MSIPQYITQLTKDWIRYVSKRLVAGNCIRIKEDSDNREVSIDIDALKLLLDLATGYVTLDTAQTITGAKTFSAAAVFQAVTCNGALTTKLYQGISFCTSDDSHTFRLRTTGTNVLLLIDNTYDTAHTLVAGTIGGNLYLGTSTANTVFLGASPTVGVTGLSAAQQKLVATCGWVVSLFSPLTHNHDGVYATASHNHDGVYATTNHTHSGYATSASVTTLQNTVANLSDAVDAIEADYVTSSSLATSLSAYSTSSVIAATYATLARAEEIEAAIEALEDALYDSNDDPKFVTTNTTQTITGDKTISNTSLYIQGTGNYYLIVQDAASPTSRTYVGKGQIWLDRDAGTIGIIFRNIARTTKASVYYLYSDTSLHLNGAAANKVVLDHAPTVTLATEGYADSKAVATCGWALTNLGAVAASSNTTLSGSGASVNSSTWTAGGSTGLVVTQQTRTYWDATNGVLYGFSRTFTYSKNGNLVSVSGETRYVIDTPTVVSWS